MKTHIHTSTAHPHYCPIHHRDFYRRTCGCPPAGCPDCALDRAVNAARQALPEAVNGRLEKAIMLVRAGNVYMANGRSAVHSQTNGAIYEVGQAGCECPDARYGAPVVADRPACKHQLAVWLARKMRETPIVGSLSVVPHNPKHAKMNEFGRRIKTRSKFCSRCGTETDHGFGLGCLTCVERYVERYKEVA